jgi:hypothetical protein
MAGEWKELGVRLGTFAIGNAFMITSLAHHAISCIPIIGALSGSAGYAQEAAKAAKMLLYIDDTLNDLKGSPQNDGLVAAESQYYPKSLHKNVLGQDPKGYTEMKDYNHADIIWAKATRDKVTAMIAEASRITR